MDKNKYPKGWNQQRVQEVIDHVETRTEEEAIAEDEAAFEQGYTAMQVPRELAFAAARQETRKPPASQGFDA